MKKNLSIIFFKVFFCSFLLIGPGIALINFLQDPIQFYRRTPGKKLFGQTRYQIAGFVKNFDYNLVVAGSSMTENFSPKLIGQSFENAKPILFSMAGSYTNEQTIALRKALATGKVKTVIWGIDQSSLTYTDQRLRPNFPTYLYEDTPETHIKYLLNFEILVDSVLGFIREYIIRSDKIPDSELLETYMNWQDKFIFSKDVILNLYKQSVSNTNTPNPGKIDLAWLRLKEQNFLADVVSLIKQYPQVKFYIFLPPYSLAQYKIFYHAHSDFFETYLKFREILFQHLTSFPNVEVYDFETDLSIVQNLDNYKDLMHHSKFINDDIILKIKNNINRVTPDNIQEKNNAFRKQVLLPLE